MSTARTIKKYSNRRLYDTLESRYVTLSEVRDLVISNEEFRVVDVGTSEDITRQVLIQIISEQENGDQPMFSEELLSQMIRFYGGAFQSVFTDYMGKTVEIINNQQQAYQKQWADMMGMGSMSSMSELAKQSIQHWDEMQKEMLKMYGFSPKREDT